jgi:hypothetical protein
MQANFVTKLYQVLSQERLDAYQQRTQTDGDLALFSHYIWNMALSESLYPGLQALEVALRNTIHNTATQQFKREDWYADQQIIHYHYNINAITKTREQLHRQRKTPDPGRVIAELSFGFWTSLFDSRYEQNLWTRLIKPAFPHMPRRIRTRKELSKRLNKIRNLRNRVFHHEPIWYWQDLPQQHNILLETLAWIEPAMREMLTSLDRFPGVYQAGPNTYTQVLRRFC